MTQDIVNINNICGIFYYNLDDYDVGVILSNENNIKITYIDFDMFGEYNGVIFQKNKKIEEICCDDEYINFMKKIIDFNSFNPLFLKNEIDFINYALNNNRILSVLFKKNDIEFYNYIKVLECDGIYLKYQMYNRCGYLYKRVNKLKISKIIQLQIDSKYTRLLERVSKD